VLREEHNARSTGQSTAPKSLPFQLVPAACCLLPIFIESLDLPARERWAEPLDFGFSICDLDWSLIG
jgi:hypothetical protein